jgi:signal transduction histidine kinase
MKLGLVIFLPLVLAFIVIGCIQKTTVISTSPAIRNTEILLLDGTWEFYFNQFLSSKDLKGNNVPFEKIDVPSTWHNDERPILGFATYRKVIILPKNLTHSSVHFPSIQSACKIYINGIALDSSGSTGQYGKYKSKIRSSTISLQELSDTVEIIVHVANYTTITSGIVKTPFIQNTSAYSRSSNLRNGIQNCIIGILVAMFLYQCILFFFNREDWSYLVLAVICLMVAIRSALITGGSQLLSELFSHVDSTFWFKLGFLTVYPTLFLFPLYIKVLFNFSAPRWPLLIYLMTSIVLTMLIVFTPHYVYAYYIDVYHGGMLTVFVYAVFSVYKAFRMGNEEAQLILWGVIISFPFILVEMLQNSRIIQLDTNLPFLTELGLLTFLQFQVILLSSRYSISFRALKSMNQNLEFIVHERTDELMDANRIKDRLLSIISHDIKSPLNSLKSVVSLFNRKKISEEQFGDMMLLLETELGKTSQLVENILTWSAEQLKGIVVKQEKFDVLKLLEVNIQLFHSALEKKEISVCHNLLSGLPVITDQSILNTVVRNLLSNAIKFTPQSGMISIQASTIGSRLLLEIKDNGVGMDELTLNSLLDPKKALINSGTANERGTGLGLLLCRELIQKLNGELRIESKVNIGSTFLVSIPIKQD